MAIEIKEVLTKKSLWTWVRFPNKLYKNILYVPVSVVSTVKTALGLVISFVISALLFKEKFTRNQLISAIIGITAVVILNIPA